MQKTLTLLTSLGLVAAATSSLDDQVQMLMMLHNQDGNAITAADKPGTVKSLFGYEWDVAPCVAALATSWRPSVASVGRFKETLLRDYVGQLMTITSTESAYNAGEIPAFLESIPGYAENDDIVWVAFYLECIDKRAALLGQKFENTGPTFIGDVVGGGVTTVDLESTHVD